MIGNKLKELRENDARKLTLVQMGEVLGISYVTYSRYEKNETDVSTDMLCKLADFYGVSTDYLLGRTEIKEPAFIDILTALGIDDSYRLSPEEFGEAFDALEQPVKVIIYKVMTEMVNKLQSISQDQATATVEDIPEPLKPFA
jgi:transcriptional regulator with XRE-family HTH domain